MLCAQPHVVGRSFVAKGWRHRPVHGEGGAREGQLQLRERSLPFMATVRHGDEVCDAQMAFAVLRVRRRRDGRRIGGPHGRGGQRIGEQTIFSIFRCRAKLRQPAVVGSVVRQEDALHQTQPEIGAHLLDALKRRSARLRGAASVLRRCQIAEA